MLKNIASKSKESLEENEQIFIGAETTTDLREESKMQGLPILPENLATTSIHIKAI